MVYGLNSYSMVALFMRGRRRALNADLEREVRFDKEVSEEDLPVVLTQIPLYNEANVAERVIRAVAEIDYPLSKHQIQVLDDSNDETVQIVDDLTAQLNADGHWIDVVRRPTREGFKAGALQYGLNQSDAAFVAIFDSDFVPTPDFLRKSLPHLMLQKEVGLVQARWGHINAQQSWLTRALAIGIDAHFLIEQGARSWNGLFLNFNGTAGVWRRQAIDDAGGWESDTLTEDMDLSYRAQIAGWRMHYVMDLVAPAEIPATFTALKSQQFRWAKGSIQTALKILPRVWSSEASLWKKLQSVFHLTHYFIHFAMMAMALISIPVIFAIIPTWGSTIWVFAAPPIILATLGPSLGCVISQKASERRSLRYAFKNLPALILVGFGISISNSRAVYEALIGKQSSFIRTPKSGTQRKKGYRLRKGMQPWIETLIGAYCLVAVALAIYFGNYGVIPFAIIYFVSYITIGLSSLNESTSH